MAFAIELSDEQWELVADLFDPPDRGGAPALIPRRDMVDAMLFIGRTGCQWRCLPERYGSWTAVRARWRRWRANGVWERAMMRLAAFVRMLHDREPFPSMVMVDARTVKGARYGPTFHERGGPGGRVNGTKRTLLVDILGLPMAARTDSARPHDVAAGRELPRERVDTLPGLRAVVGDRAHRGLAALAARKHLALDIRVPPPGSSGFVPLRPLVRIEHAFAQLARWRRVHQPLAAERSRPGERSRAFRGLVGHTVASCDVAMSDVLIDPTRFPSEGDWAFCRFDDRRIPAVRMGFHRRLRHLAGRAAIGSGAPPPAPGGDDARRRAALATDRRAPRR